MTGIYTSEWRVQVVINDRHCMYNNECCSSSLTIRCHRLHGNISHLTIYNLQYEIEKPLKSKECLNMEYII